METSFQFQVAYANKYKLPEVYRALHIDPVQEHMFLVVMNNPDFLSKLTKEEQKCDRCATFIKKEDPQKQVQVTSLSCWQYPLQTTAPNPANVSRLF
jgi:hypothetical protein